jgi:enoyl-CoA hydratase/carnithine racemase
MEIGNLTAAEEYFEIERKADVAVLRIVSSDGANKLGMARIRALHRAVQDLSAEAESGEINRLIITGNGKFFSAGADLNEISGLTAAQAFQFSREGQALMLAIDEFPVPVIAAIRGYCMGGGMDLALACDYRIAAANAVFGHRGASLGVMTGWGGTQRLPRLIGKARAMQMFLLAEMVKAEEALRIGLVDEIAEDPVSIALDLKSCSGTAHHATKDDNMSMRMQVADVGTYQITLYKNNEGLWDFWIKQKGHLLVKSTGTGDCQETKLLVQQHLDDVVMTKKERKHFAPNDLLEWRNRLCGPGGNAEVAG